MKYLTFVLFMEFLMACGGGSSKPTDAAAAEDSPQVDASTSDASTSDALPDAGPMGVCDPHGAPGSQNCPVGEKCTWITVEESPQLMGELGCVPDGSVAIGAACMRGPAGATTGYDNCVAGGFCIGASTAATCKDLCGFDGGAQEACQVGEMCTRYEGLGTNGNDPPILGACNSTCDPLKQTRIVNGVTQSCGTGQGCYLLASTVDTVAVCGRAGTPTHNQPISGTTFANSCAPGHVPRQAVQGVSGNECTSLCKPTDVYMGMNEASEGGVATETNYAGLPATCESAGGAAVRPEVPGTGESCQHYWTREPADHITNFSNTLGWCFNHASWKYDPDGQQPINNTASYPRCPTLTTGDVVPPVDPSTPHNDALYFACVALPMAFRSTPKPRSPTSLQLDRLGPYNR